MVPSKRRYGSTEVEFPTAGGTLADNTLRLDVPQLPPDGGRYFFRERES